MHALFFFMVDRKRKLWVLIICECMYKKKMMDYFRNVVACYLFKNECILDVVECMVGFVLAWKENPYACDDFKMCPAEFIDLACALFVNTSYGKRILDACMCCITYCL